MSTPVVLSVTDWNPTSMKYMAPKVNKSGGKSISIISRQTNRSLYVSTPLMMTWGISDFVNEDGVSDGKYGITLNFPNADYKSKATDDFLQKIKDFETQIMNDAVANSELWWGEEMSHAVCKHTFFPILKYSKDPKSKKPDLTKPPSIRAKVPMYDGKWSVEVYDTRNNLLYPSSTNLEVTPPDFVTKLSSVACVLQCGGIWIGGKGWGLTWKLIQCVVKPKEVVSVNGTCHIQLSLEERGQIESQKVEDEDVDESSLVLDIPQAHAASSQEKAVVPPPAPAPAEEAPSTLVEDSDDDDESNIPEAVPLPVKKVIKKVTPAPVAAPEPEPEPEAAPAAEAVAAPVKKVVKKVVAKK